MRVLLISSFFPPTHVDGTEKRTLGYAVGLQQSGHQVQVLCCGTWQQGDKYWNGVRDEIYRDISIRRVDLNWMLAPDPNRYLYDNPVIESKLDAWLDEWQPDIVHITSCITMSASVIQAVKRHGIPIVLTLTDFWFVCPKLSLLRSDGVLCDGQTTEFECLKCTLARSNIGRSMLKILPEQLISGPTEWVSHQPTLTRHRGLRGMALDFTERRAFLKKALNSVDKIISPSHSLRQIIEAVGITQGIEVIYSGHDLNWLAKMPIRKPTETLRLGYIGQINNSKCVHVLIDALALSSNQTKMSLSIYGDTSKEPKYVQKLKESAQNTESHVEFFESFTHDKLGEVLALIDVLVVPSQWHENNPRVIQEAFASKIPVVATNVGGISEFVHHEVNGLLFERNNSTSLARQLDRLVTTPSLLKRLNDGIYAVKTNAQEISQLEEIYAGLTQKRSSYLEIAHFHQFTMEEFTMEEYCL